MIKEKERPNNLLTNYKYTLKNTRILA